MADKWQKGKILKVHSMRDNTYPPKVLAQMWVVEGEDGEEYLLSAKPGWEVKFLTDPENPGIIKRVEVTREETVHKVVQDVK